MPIAPTNGGIIIGTSIKLESNPLNLNLNLPITKASGRVRMVVIKVTVMPRIKLLIMHSLSTGFVNIYWKNTAEKLPSK